MVWRDYLKECRLLLLIKMQIFFFTTPKPLFHVGHYSPPKSEQDIIASFINAGYAPSVNSVEKPKKIEGEGIFWDGKGKNILPINQWKEGDEIFFLCLGKRLNASVFEPLLGIGKGKRVLRSAPKPFAQPCLKAPSFMEFETLPDGRLVQRVDGGIYADNVNELIRTLSCDVPA